MGKYCKALLNEFGEQVLATPMRQQKTQRTVSLKSRWIDAKYVGMTRHDKELVVVLLDAQRLNYRWSLEAIKAIKFHNPQNIKIKMNQQLKR